MRPRPLLLYVVTEDWYFMSHRYGLACRARDAGWRVAVATRVGDHGAALRAAGFEVHPVPFERSLRHPLRDLVAWHALGAVYRRVRPDLVHLVSLKPILLGGLLPSRRPPPTVLAFTGLGYVFSSPARLARLLRPLVVGLLARAARRATWSIVQNEDDRALLARLGVLGDEQVSVIAGSGVDLAAFPALPPAAGERPVVLLPARVLRDKGVHEFARAAALLRTSHPHARCVIAGAHDRDNPGAVASADLEAWVASGVLEWWGHRTDMADVYAASSVVCLPSYREGLPKALLEAAASARPLVASAVPGCREICVDGESGLSEIGRAHV